MPIATLDLTLDSPVIHPGTSIMAEVKIKNTGKSVLTLSDEAYFYANEYEIAPKGDEKHPRAVSVKMSLASRGHADPITLHPNEENSDREDLAEYLSETLKPGSWSIRAARKVSGKDILRSTWSHATITPWQLGAMALRFDPLGQHWQSAILNHESGGSSKLWSAIPVGLIQPPVLSRM